MSEPTAVTRYSPARVVGVTLGLSAAGAVFGGVAGATALGVALFIDDGLAALKELSVVLVPGVIGAVLGAVCAPLAGWLLLRRVPLGRVFGGLSLGTILGGIAGWYLPLGFDPINQPIATAAVGFLVAAVVLHVRQRRQDKLKGGAT